MQYGLRLQGPVYEFTLTQFSNCAYALGAMEIVAHGLRTKKDNLVHANDNIFVRVKVRLFASHFSVTVDSGHYLEYLHQGQNIL